MEKSFSPKKQVMKETKKQKASSRVKYVEVLYMDFETSQELS